MYVVCNIYYAFVMQSLLFVHNPTKTQRRPICTFNLLCWLIFIMSRLKQFWWLGTLSWFLGDCEQIKENSVITKLCLLGFVVMLSTSMGTILGHFWSESFSFNQAEPAWPGVEICQALSAASSPPLLRQPIRPHLLLQPLALQGRPWLLANS